MTRQTSHVIVAKDTPGVSKPVRPRDPVASGERDAAFNRQAGHNYFLLEKFEAGIALRGTEVKSIREGKANLKDAYGLVKDGEAFPVESAYWTVLSWEPGQPRRNPHSEAAHAPGRSSQAVL